MEIEFISKKMTKYTERLEKDCSAYVTLDNGIKLYISFQVNENNKYFNRISDDVDEVNKVVEDILYEGIPFYVRLNDNNSINHKINKEKSATMERKTIKHEIKELFEQEVQGFKNIDMINKCISSLLISKYSLNEYNTWLRYVENAYIENEDLIITIESKEKMDIFILRYFEEIKRAYKILVGFNDMKVVLVKNEDEIEDFEEE